MDIQSTIVMLILAAAAIFIGLTFVRKARAFGPKSGCGDDCGCNATSKKLHS